MRKINSFLLVFITCLLSSALQAQLTLPALFSSNMVFQRNAVDPVWGSAPGGVEVLVTFAGHNYTTRADEQGRWRVDMKVKGEGGPYVLKIKSGSDSIILLNILVGEVWLCSGQSNMEMPLQGWPNGDGTYRYPVANYKEEIRSASYPHIRLLQVEPAYATTEKNDIGVIGTTWRECSPASIPTFSSTAYFFAREVYKRTGIPIGLIQSCVGGTTAQLWTPESELRSMPVFDAQLQDTAFLSKHLLQKRPGALFNAMIAPLIPFGIRGVLWYQGEFNTDSARQYRELFPKLITGWRSRWHRGDFPFYYVQLPIINQRDTFNMQSKWAELRDAQLNTLSVRNTAMMVTIDLPDNDLHPANKQDFGRRLALVVLAKLYGRSSAYTGPLFKKAKRRGASVKIAFSNPQVGLKAKGDSVLSGFYISGNDRVFHPAQAVIRGNSVWVSSSVVQSPAAVRYAWADWPVANLVGKDGLPASPFRTDHW